MRSREDIEQEKGEGSDKVSDVMEEAYGRT